MLRERFGAVHQEYLGVARRPQSEQVGLLDGGVPHRREAERLQELDRTHRHVRARVHDLLQRIPDEDAPVRLRETVVFQLRLAPLQTNADAFEEFAVGDDLAARRILRNAELSVALQAHDAAVRLLSDRKLHHVLGERIAG